MAKVLLLYSTTDGHTVEICKRMGKVIEAEGDTVELAPDTDGGIIERNDVAITYLTRLQHENRDDLGSIAKSLDTLLGG